MSTQKEPAQAKGVFDQYAFAFIESKDMSQALIKTVRLSLHLTPPTSHNANIELQLRDTVEKYDGEIIERDKKGKLEIAKCTHIVACTIDFPEYNEAMAMMVPVVKPAWVNVSLQRNRHAQIRPYSPDPRLIFSDVNITCEDIPIYDREAIAGAVLALGGTESKDLGRLTTHICALTTDGRKAMTAREKKLKCKIVLPHWSVPITHLASPISNKA